MARHCYEESKIFLRPQIQATCLILHNFLTRFPATVLVAGNANVISATPLSRLHKARFDEVKIRFGEYFIFYSVFVFVVSVYKILISIEEMLPIPVSVRSVAVCLLGSGIEGSNPPERHGYSSLVFVVCCVGSVFAKSWSLVQRSPTVCVYDISRTQQ